MTFTDTSAYVDLSGKTAFLRREGVLQFGKPVKGGLGVIVASAIKATYTPHEGGIFNSLDALLGDERTITVGKVSYNKGGALNGDVPSGKPWLRYDRPLPGGISGLYSQLVNPAEPATLQALIKSGTKSGRTFKGHISRAELWRVSPWYRASAMSKSKDRAFAFELTLGPDNLPQRLVTSHPAAEHRVQSLVGDDVITVESRYTRWGGKLRVTAPPAKQVYSRKKGGS
ncbi:hypothetical protein [Nonomuraea sp. NPDC005692]|uniref:hypothetical protein n=1 Tax=Nonomuraea sp. NPDC005692 TaxID=3157168 RepID=UPI0033F8EF39